MYDKNPFIRNQVLTVQFLHPFFASILCKLRHHRLDHFDNTPVHSPVFVYGISHKCAIVLLSIPLTAQSGHMFLSLLSDFPVEPLFVLFSSSHIHIGALLVFLPANFFSAVPAYHFYPFCRKVEVFYFLLELFAMQLIEVYIFIHIYSKRRQPLIWLWILLFFTDSGRWNNHYCKPLLFFLCC